MCLGKGKCIQVHFRYGCLGAIWKPTKPPSASPCPQMPTVIRAVCLEGCSVSPQGGPHSRLARCQLGLHFPPSKGTWFLGKPSGGPEVLSLYLNCTQDWVLFFSPALRQHTQIPWPQKERKSLSRDRSLHENPLYPTSLCAELGRDPPEPANRNRHRHPTQRPQETLAQM